MLKATTMSYYQYLCALNGICNVPIVITGSAT